jgi:thioesterase domain-containing protein
LQQPQEISELEQFPGNVEGIAAAYIAQVLEQNPNGPYALAGHCFGGIIAFEMAKQLEQMGKEVNLVALLDTYLPKIDGYANGTHTKMNRIKKTLQYVLLKSYKNIYLFLRDSRLALRYRKNSFMQLTNNIKKKISHDKDKDVEKYEFSEKVTQQYRKAIRDYQIAHYNRHILLYRAKMASFKWDDYRYLGWRSYTDALEIHEIEGDHLTMLHSKHFADLVQRDINRHTTDNE